MEDLDLARRDLVLRQRLRCLEAEQIHMIDEALAELGEYGELHLVVEKGKIRFLVVQKSIDANKWQPGRAGRDGARA